MQNHKAICERGIKFSNKYQRGFKNKMDEKDCPIHDSCQQRLIERIDSVVKRMDGYEMKQEDVYNKLHKIEVEDGKKEIQYLNLEKTLTELLLTQKENKGMIQSLEDQIKDQNESMVNRVIESQGAMFKSLIERDFQEIKTNSEGKKSDNGLQAKKDVLQAKKETKKWEMATKIILGIVGAVMAYIKLFDK